MSYIEIFRSIGALLLTLGLLLGLAWVLKRYGLLGNVKGQGQALKRLKIIENLWLDAGRTRIVIIACDGKEQLILIGPNGASQIGNIDNKTNDGDL